MCNAGSHVCSLPGCAARRDPACPTAARPSQAGPTAGQAGLRAPRAGWGRGWSAGVDVALRARPCGGRRPGGQGPRGEEGAFASEGRAGGGGREAPSGARAPAGAAWRARSGGGASRGSGGGATAAPPEAKFEKRTRFPPFFKPKNKTFSTISPASRSPPGPSPLPLGPGRPL